jgi:DedD protein
MAFFKFRKSNDETPTAPVLPDSLEAMRRRAKYRLIGSAVLVLIGVVGFPLLFDKQPRPISVDMPIDIPDRNKVKPLTLPVAAVLAPPTAEPTKSAAIIEEKAQPEPLSAAPPAPKVAAKNEFAAVAKVEESEKAKAPPVVQGPDKSAEAVVGRYVVQVGAFADPAKAREVRLKLESAGLKTYTQVAETKEGARIRVRVGPFSTKDEADKVALKVKSLKLAAAILTL